MKTKLQIIKNQLLIFAFILISGSVYSQNLALGKTYAASSGQAGQDAAKAFDNDLNTNWQSATGFPDSWLQVNFGTATQFNQVTLSEWSDRCQGFIIEYSTDGVSWTAAYTGTTIGTGVNVFTSETFTFTAVTGNYARVKFTSGTGNPIIYEFEIYSVADPVYDVNYALNQAGTASSGQTGQDAAKAFDGDLNTNWQAATGFPGTWLQVDLGQTRTFDRFVISEWGDRTSGFVIEYSTDGLTWNTAYTGTTIGTDSANPLDVTFAPAVTGRYARILYTSGSGSPIVYEFEIYQNNPALSVADELFAKELRLYPNPAQDKLFLQLPEAHSIKEIVVYDLLGKQVLSNGISTQIDISGLSRGIYILRLETETAIATKKFIKK